MADEWLKVTFLGKADPQELLGMDPGVFWEKMREGEIFSMVDSLCVERTTLGPMLSTHTVPLDEWPTSARTCDP